MNTKRCQTMLSLAVILVGLLLPTVSVHAQGGPSSDQISRLERELQVTAELLERAQEAVERANIPTAVLALENAFQLQRQAMDAFRGGRYILCAGYMRRAQERGKLALSLARQAEQFEGAVLRRLERSAELLRRAQEQVQESDNRQLQALFQMTRDNLERAREFYRQHQYKPALKLAEQVEEAARRLAAATGVTSEARANFERRRMHADDFVEATAELVADCDAPQAQAFLNQARDALQMGDRMMDEDHPARALQALKQARDAAKKAARVCQADGRLESTYERLMQETDRIAEQHGSTDVLRELLQRTREQLTLARKHMNSDRPEAAAAALRAASLTLRKAKELAATSG